ncbi:MAG: acyl-CoA thioesterase [Bacteroidota bacterium]
MKKITHNSKLRTRYAETDRMGYVYYGNYATYFEVARVEWLQLLGIRYRELEENGIALPVSEYSIKYLKPAYYDQELTIKTTLMDLTGVRIRFEYETYNESGELINTAQTTLVFFDIKTSKPCPIPLQVMDAYDRYVI